MISFDQHLKIYSYGYLSYICQTILKAKIKFVTICFYAISFETWNMKNERCTLLNILIRYSFYIVYTLYQCKIPFKLLACETNLTILKQNGKKK